MRWGRLWLLGTVLAACGQGGATLELALYTPVAEEQNPFDGVRQLKVVVSGPIPLSVPPQFFDVATGSARLTGLPLARYVSVMVEGLSGLDATPISRGSSPPVDLVSGTTLRLPVFFAKIGRFAGNVSVVSRQRSDLREARAGHTTTLLKDGRLLVLGGAILSAQGALAGLPLARAEVYDPQTGESSSIGSMSSPRAFHTATLLKTGLVLVAGGVSLINETLAPLATAELFEPATGTFRATEGGLQEHNGRAGHSATLLADGRVLLAGGWGQETGGPRAPLASAELFDPDRRAFATVGPMGSARANHSATALLDTRVLVAGGRGPAGALHQTELFDPALGGFTPGPNLPDNIPRAGHAAVRLGSGLVLIVGGCRSPEAVSASATAATGSGCHVPAAVASVLDRVELYDHSAPPVGRFAPGQVPALTMARADLSATLLPGDDRVLVAGGVRSDGSTASVAEILEEQQGGRFERRQAANELRAPRVFHAAARLSSGLVLLAGGAGRSGTAAVSPFSILGSIELYTP
jgi:hypothetical protein